MVNHRDGIHGSQLGFIQEGQRAIQSEREHYTEYPNFNDSNLQTIDKIFELFEQLFSIQFGIITNTAYWKFDSEEAILRTRFNDHSLKRFYY